MRPPPASPAWGRNEVLSRFLRLLLPAAVLVLTVPACDSSKPPAGQVPTYPVRGKVMVNGQPAAGAFVLFIPANEPDPPLHPRPRATVGDDGTFALSTFGEADGAPAGDYVIAVRWQVDGKDEKDRLGERYAEPGRSRLKATVAASPNELQPFLLK